jgi:spermidine synthase
MTDIAKKHFRLEPNPRLSIYHQDARVFLNNTENTYDAILGDAFGSFFSIPYQLTTLEVAQKKYDLLSEH